MLYKNLPVFVPGHMNPKRILIIREASESDYPDAVTRKFSTRRVQNIVFTSEGRLSDVARRTLEASCATSKARTAAQQDPASSQWYVFTALVVPFFFLLRRTLC